MTPVHQTITACPIRQDGHNADGRPGNCIQAAVANMLDLELEEVPHFLELPDGHWWNNLRRWLQARALDVVCLGPETPGEMERTLGFVTVEKVEVVRAGSWCHTCHSEPVQATVAVTCLGTIDLVTATVCKCHPWEEDQ